MNKSDLKGAKYQSVICSVIYETTFTKDQHDTAYKSNGSGLQFFSIVVKLKSRKHSPIILLKSVSYFFHAYGYTSPIPLIYIILAEIRKGCSSAGCEYCRRNKLTFTFLPQNMGTIVQIPNNLPQHLEFFKDEIGFLKMFVMFIALAVLTRLKRKLIQGLSCYSIFNLTVKEAFHVLVQESQVKPPQ